MHRQQFVEGLRVEGPLAREHLEENQAERVEVGFDGWGAAGEQLRRHVLRSAGTRRGDVACGDCQPEIGDADVSIAVDHHVRRLQVAVQDAALVSGGDAGAQLTRDLDGFVLREPSNAAQQRCEVLAVDVFHREEPSALVLAEIVETADVLVRHLARDAQLGVELREPIGIGADACGQKLQRDRLIERQVVGAIDLAHAAAPKKRDEPVPARDDRARRPWHGRARGQRRRPGRPRHGARGCDRQVEIVMARHERILRQDGRQE
jgi:hypothetical protein